MDRGRITLRGGMATRIRERITLGEGMTDAGEGLKAWSCHGGGAELQMVERTTLQGRSANKADGEGLED